MSNFDKRVVERNLNRGVVTKEEYEKEINEEEDCFDNLEESEVRFVHKVREDTEDKKDD